jgi:hypothetical protein
MADRPIIFSAPMVRALLDGRKTQTRRLVKRGPVREWLDAGFNLAFVNDPGNASALPYQRGDRLWVREAGNWQAAGTCQITGRHMRFGAYGADADPSAFSFFGGKKRPSIHMPRWASRLTLTVTEVRVQRLQEISEEDALAEGVDDERCCRAPSREFGPGDWGNACCGQPTVTDPREEFRALWTSIHGPGAWDENPEVVALTFTVERKNVDA